VARRRCVSRVAANYRKSCKWQINAAAAAAHVLIKPRNRKYQYQALNVISILASLAQSAKSKRYIIFLNAEWNGDTYVKCVTLGPAIIGGISSLRLSRHHIGNHGIIASNAPNARNITSAIPSAAGPAPDPIRRLGANADKVK